VSGRERLGYFSEGQGKALRGTAAKWQAYMDANFGHSQDAVAAARIGTAEQTLKAGSRGRDGRDPWGESRHKRRSLIDTLAGSQHQCLRLHRPTHRPNPHHRTCKALPTISVLTVRLERHDWHCQAEHGRAWAGNSWVSEAETDPVPSKKPVRFPDSLN